MISCRSPGKELAIFSKVAEVIVDIPSREVDRIFDYAVPERLRDKAKIGSLVQVPFGKTVKAGYLIDLKNESVIPKLAEISEVLEKSVISQEQIDLAKWIAHYYISSLSETLRLMMPPGQIRKPKCFFCLIGSPEQALVEKVGSKVQKRIIEALAKGGGCLDFDRLRLAEGGSDSFSRDLAVLVRKGLVERVYGLEKPAIKTRKIPFVRLKLSEKDLGETLASLSKAPKQQALLEKLAGEKEMSVAALLAQAGSSRSALKAAAAKGWIELWEEETTREPDVFFPEATKDDLVLTTDQENALAKITDSIDQNQPRVFLLQGVTGSGKTEIYLRAIAKVIKEGKTAIVLVPEISLTPQTVQRFKNRFGPEKVAVLHSGLSLGERYDQWMKIAKGDYRVVVGARSAVFAPLKEVGLIVIDEEHEPSYKQNRNPRYHARDVAIKRAELNGASVVLGSATPSMETRFLADQGIYQLLFLPDRVEGKPLPEIRIVNMREVSAQTRPARSRIISDELRDQIQKTAEQGGKTILFLNRRGYSGFVQCRDCGEVIKCRHCEVSLTYHLTGRILKCHHCGYACPAPRTCPNCRSLRIGYFGVGTQRVEAEVTGSFPGLPLVRMDADTTARKGMHQKRLIEFQRAPQGILLGTQMIAKGLDFPEVTLVGIINADVALNLPDFRAGERTFQLLMQVSGRAGRGEQSGLVLIQSYQPENYAIEAVLNNRYEDFYHSEIEFRRGLNYPPFSRLINIVLSGLEEKRVEETAEKISQVLAESGILSPGELLGPAPAPIARIKNRYRWHLVVKSGALDGIKNYLRRNYSALLKQSLKQGVNLIIDVDPVTML